MKNKRLTEKTFSNLIWRFAERCGAQGVSFIVSIILARLLSPDAYGMIALVTVFISILQVFVDSGLGNALIQKKDADDLDFSTVFYFNIVMCIILYLIMYIASPKIALFYDMPELVSVIRVLSFIIIISGVKNVQQAFVSKNLMFKRFFFSSLGGTIGSAVVGILLAYLGFGVWALVIQQIFNTTLDTIIIWVTVKWRPKLIFSFNRLSALFSYGWKLLISSLLDNVYDNLRQFIIGKLYSSTDLAYYNRGKQLPNLIVTNINSSIDSVLLPVMSQEQDDRKKIKNMTRRAIKTSSFIMWPLMIGLMVTSKYVVILLLTEKWLKCVPFLQIFCFTYALWPIHTANLNAIKAMGRSDLFLKLEIIKKSIGIGILILTMKLGVLVMAYSLLATNILSSFINSYPNKRLLGYSYIDQITDIMPSMILSIFMGCIIYTVKYLYMNSLLTLIIQVLLGSILYIGCSKVFRFESFEYILYIIRGFLSKNKR